MKNSIVVKFSHSLLLVIGVCLVLLSGCANSIPVTASYDEAKATQDIWAKELAIYEARGRGDLQVYLDSTSLKYLGWPPGWEKPNRLDKLRSGAQLMKEQKATQEELTMKMEDITFSGDTSVIYYSTHRTRMPTGEEVDQRFEVIHVWTKEDGVWNLIGGMARDKQDPDKIL